MKIMFIIYLRICITHKICQAKKYRRRVEILGKNGIIAHYEFTFHFFINFKNKKCSNSIFKWSQILNNNSKIKKLYSFTYFQKVEVYQQ